MSAELSKLADIQERMRKLQDMPATAVSAAAFWVTFDRYRRLIDDLCELESDAPRKESLRGVIARMDDFRFKVSEAGMREYLTKLQLQLALTRPIADNIVTDLKDKYAAAPHDDKRQVLHSVRFARSNDAHGVVVRGHIIVAKVLSECIEAYAAQKPTERLKKTLKFGAKIKIAHRWGILNDAERDFLATLSKLRASVAHEIGGIPDADNGYEFEWSREKALWDMFSTSTAFRGPWPEYDSSQFPQYMRYMILHIYIHLARRLEEILGKRKPPDVMSDELRGAYVRITIVMLKLLSATDDYQVETV